MLSTRRAGRSIGRAALGVVLFAAGIACRQEMYDQPRYKPLGKSDFFADDRQARPRIDGTVPRGSLREDGRLFTGRTGPTLVAELPLALSPELFTRGRRQYDVFCAPCHDRTGGGRGMVVRRGYRQPPALQLDRLRQAPVGHFYDVITNGLGAMPDYAQQISVEDRWAIVAYIRALQLSQGARTPDLTSADRAALDAPPAPSPAPETRTPFVEKAREAGKRKH